MKTPSKSKGSKFEREIKKALIELLEVTDLDEWFLVNRAVNYQAGEDISIINKSTGKKEMVLECKCGKHPNIEKAMTQLDKEIVRPAGWDYYGTKDILPVVISRKDKTGKLATMRLEDWTALFLPLWLDKQKPKGERK